MRSREECFRFHLLGNRQNGVQFLLTVVKGRLDFYLIVNSHWYIRTLNNCRSVLQMILFDFNPLILDSSFKLDGVQFTVGATNVERSVIFFTSQVFESCLLIF